MSDLTQEKKLELYNHAYEHASKSVLVLNLSTNIINPSDELIKELRKHRAVEVDTDYKFSEIVGMKQYSAQPEFAEETAIQLNIKTIRCIPRSKKNTFYHVVTKLFYPEETETVFSKIANWFKL